MTQTIQADPLPLRLEDDGTIRIGKSRIQLEIVVGDYERGASPEVIADSYDTLQLADIYAVIAYYLRHREEVAAYIERRDREAAELRAKLEAGGMSNPNFWEELKARKARMDRGNGQAVD